MTAPDFAAEPPIAIVVSEHAIDRYCERVANLPRPVVLARILESAKAVACAARFGASTVICGDGVRLKLVDSTVVTVLASKKVRRL